MNTPVWSVIVIGRNEALHLPRTLSAAKRAANLHKAEVIYADSGSTDESVAIARSMGVTIVPGNPVRPCASFPRNAGAAVAQGKYLCFIDGDIELDESFLASAEKAFLENTKAAMICGTLAERNQGSKLVQFADSWTATVTGEIDYPVGGGGAVRAEVFKKCGGYNINLIRGEELDLGYRLRQAGYTILALPVTFGIHDLGITGLRSFLKRVEHMGKSYAYVLLDNDRSWNGEFLKRAKKNIVWFLLVVVCAAGLSVALLVAPVLAAAFAGVIVLLAILVTLLRPRKNFFIFLLEKAGLVFYQMKYVVIYMLSYRINNNDDIQSLAEAVNGLRMADKGNSPG